jgi:hypothetical protein
MALAWKQLKSHAVQPKASKMADVIQKALDFSREYREGGSAQFDAPEQLKKRALIRRFFRIDVAVLKFWTVSGKLPEQTMNETEYTNLHRRFSLVLAPDLSDEAALQSAKDDWKEDAKGGKRLTLSSFTDGLFGIADMWTDDVSETSYVKCAYAASPQEQQHPPASLPSPWPGVTHPAPTICAAQQPLIVALCAPAPRLLCTCTDVPPLAPCAAAAQLLERPLPLRHHQGRAQGRRACAPPDGLDQAHTVRRRDLGTPPPCERSAVPPQIWAAAETQRLHRRVGRTLRAQRRRRCSSRSSRTRPSRSHPPPRPPASGATPRQQASGPKPRCNEARANSKRS